MRQSSFVKAVASLVRRSTIGVFLLPLVAIGSLAVGPQAGAATPPPNDLRANATVIPSLPFSDALDVSAATSDPDDSVGLSLCFPGDAFTTSRSVWYTYTAAADVTLAIDLSETNFGTGVVTTLSDGTINCEIHFGRGDNGQMYAHMGAGETVSILIYDTGPPSADDTFAVSFYAVTVPANDKIGGATAIHSLPFTAVEDTLLATSDVDDIQANAGCGLPSTNYSVWYRFTAGRHDTSVLFEATRSAHSSGYEIVVATGTPGSLTTVACGSGLVVVSTSPGTTYYVMVSGSGGRLQLDVERTPPPAAIDASFRGTGVVDHLGTAYLSGTYSCSSALVAGINARATQNNQSGFAFISDPIVCDGRRHGFQVAVSADPGAGQFVAGKIVVQATAFACNVLGCANWFPTGQIVKLVMGSPHQ